MKLHIITPCSRPGWLIPAFRSIEQAVREAGIDCTWTLIVTPQERLQFPDLWMGGWVELFICKPYTEGAVCEKKLNEFMEKSDIDPDTYLWIFSDDNLLPVNVLKAIKKEYDRYGNNDPDAVVVSHKRGQRNDVHGCWDLVAHPDNMKFCYTSGEQVFFKRKHFIPWEESNHGDGRFIEHLYSVAKDKIVYLPDIWTAFNAQKSQSWNQKDVQRVVFEKGGIDL